MARKIIIGNGKGGVGKTTLASVIIEVWRAEKGDYPAVMIDCDSRNKLAKMFKDRVLKIAISAEPEEIIANPGLVVSYWDQLGDHLISDTDAVVDLGANVDQSVLEWARRSKIGRYLDNISLDVIVPTTGDPLGIEGAREMLKATAAIFPSARRTLVLNAWTSKLDETYKRDSSFLEITSLPGVEVVRVPKCTSEIWEDIVRDSVSFAHAIELGPEAIGKSLKLSRPWLADRGVGDLAAWAEKVVPILRPLVI